MRSETSARVAAVAEAALVMARAQHSSPLAGDVARLSASFTDQRGGRHRDYMRQPAAQRAYLAFWVPHNVARIAGVLERARAEGHLPASGALRVVDLGAGPLSATLAVWCVYGALGPSWAMDLARKALDTGLALLRRVAGDVDVTLRDGNVTPQWADRLALGDGVDLVIAANVLNELSDPRDLGPRRAVVRSALRATREGGRVLLIEPAMRLEARALMGVRDSLGDDVDILSPCCGAEQCPMLARPADWCHQTIPWPSRPPSFVALETAARLPKDALAVAHLLLARGDRPPAKGPDFVRLVGGTMTDSAGQERRYACGEGLLTLAGQPKLPTGVARATRGERVLADDVAASVSRAPAMGGAPLSARSEARSTSPAPRGGRPGSVRGGPRPPSPPKDPRRRRR